jgi:hypothetical protein
MKLQTRIIQVLKEFEINHHQFFISWKKMEKKEKKEEE